MYSVGVCVSRVDMAQSSWAAETGERQHVESFFPVGTLSRCLVFVFVCLRLVVVCVCLSEDAGMWSLSAVRPLPFSQSRTRPNICVSVNEGFVFHLLLQADATLL